MREQLTSVRSLKFISIAEAALIIYLVILFIYLLTHVGQNSGVTITPGVTTLSPAVTSPAISTTPTSGTQQPTGKAASSQPAFYGV